MHHVSLSLALSLVAGLAGGVAFDTPVVLAITLTLTASWVVWVLGHRHGEPRAQLAATCLFVASSGWLLGAQAVDRALNAPLRTLLDQRLGGFAFSAADRRVDEPITIEGELLADAVPRAEGTVLRLDVRRVWIGRVAELTSGGVSLSVGGEPGPMTAAAWTAARVVRVSALLRRPARYLNDGLADQERALARRGISLVGSIKSAALVDVLERGTWWQETAAAVRARTRAALARHVGARDGQAAAVGTAILIGDRAGLSRDTEERLQEAGTYHVIAISGGNIAILVAVLLGGMTLAGVRGQYAALGTIGVLIAYGIVAAGGASVLRATLMAVVYLAIRLIDQRTSPVNALSVTASALLLANPLHIVDVGFWFTFGATAALIVAAQVPRAQPTKGLIASVRGAPRYLGMLRTALVAVLVGTVCVEIALAPMAAFVFQRVTLAGVLLNFVALPAMTVVQLTAMAVVAADVAALDNVAAVSARVHHLASAALTGSAILVDYAPWLTWRVPSPHPLLLAAYYACLTLSIVSVKLGWRRWILPAGTLSLLAWILIAPGARMRAFGDGLLHVTMIDVGQGDALLVTFPNGRTLVVDTGGTPRGEFDIGDRVIGPALRARGLLSLDYLLVTHGDADHLGGAHSIVRDFSPREIWWGVPVAGHEATALVRTESATKRAAWRTLQRPHHVMIGDVELRVLHPPPADWERHRIRNNDSVVLELRYGRVSVLLTGDIEREAEEQLAPTLDLLPLVVLKVPHHGSLTSSTPAFLRAVHPAVALIGAGRGNTYGHPAPYVLGRLHDVGAEIFRTDLDGQIDVVTDGQSIRTTTFVGSRFSVLGSRFAVLGSRDRPE